MSLSLSGDGAITGMVSASSSDLSTALDAKLDIPVAWTAWTPTLTASTTNPTLGTGSTAAGFYVQIGKIVHFRGNITFGTSGTNNGNGFYFVSLPVTSKSATGFTPIGNVLIEDINVGKRYIGLCIYNTSTTFAIQMQTDSTGSFAATHTSPFTWAASDYIRFSGTYEAA